MTAPEPSFSDLGGRAVVRIERLLRHPVERVWAAVTRPEQLARWFPTGVTIELAAGGVVRYEWDGGEADGADPSRGEVLAIDPPHLLAFTWGDDRLRFELAPEGEGTRFVLVHDFADRAGAASYVAGWEGCLDALAAVVAGGATPAPSRMVDRHEELVVRFGLDRPSATEADGRWTLRWERQLTCPDEVARDLCDGLAGDGVEVHLVEGSGHGARLVLTATGSSDHPGGRDAAEARWGAAVARVAGEASAWARAHADELP